MEVAIAACALIGAASWPTPDERPLTYADVVRAAVADVRQLPPDVAASTRYLSAHERPPAERPQAGAVLSWQVNSVSREGFIVRPRQVQPWLWAIDLRDYQIDPTVYAAAVFTTGNPLAVEPYYHANLLINGETVTGSAPWLPAKEMAELIQLTGSETPIVRADWWIYRSAIQEGRAGFGYADLLGLKSRADAEKLAGLDRKAAERIYREHAGIIEDSGVVLLPRQLFRYSCLTGAWWESRDVKKESAGTGEKNATRQLLGDYKHDAEEIVFTLPNRLPGFYLSDAAGVGVASAPPDIASDGKSTNNDKRVHVGLSCIRCHRDGGLIPFEDTFRKEYTRLTGFQFGAVDSAQFRRLRSVYLGPLTRAYTADVAQYAMAIEETCGLTPAGLSDAVTRQWSLYIDYPLTVADAARECGLSEEEFASRLKAWAERNGVVDPVVKKLMNATPTPVRREHFEEVFPLLMQILDYPGVNP